MNNNTISTALDFVVGDFTVHTSRNLITQGTEETLITPKMLALLTELAKHQGETLSKTQLLTSVWGSVHTSDMVLSRAISDLRKVFGDSAKQQTYIETVTKQGYRLKMPVDSSPKNLDNATRSDSQTKPRKSASTYALVISVIAVTIFFAIMLIDEKSNLLTYPQNDHRQKRTITDDSDVELSVRFSKNGKHLAYSSTSKNILGSRIKLYSFIDSNNTDLSSLINSSEEENSKVARLAPVFSPDGSMLAYKHLKNQSCQIRLFDLASSTESTLAECPYSKTHALDWSPDGQYLVSTFFNFIKKVEGLTLIDTTSGISTQLREPAQPASGYLWPRFSPDGSRIAVVYFQPNSNLWTLGVVSVISGEFTELVSLGDQADQVVWHESGEAVYYLTGNSADKGLWKFDLQTKESQLVEGLSARSMDYNAVKKQFVFVKKYKSMSIWRSFETVDGNRVSELVLKDLKQTHYPSLSPDNNKLAFVSTGSGIDSLWIRWVNRKSQALLFQSNEKEKLSEPTWSPDGKQLLISALSKNSSRIIQFDVELGNSKQWQSNNNVKMGKWSDDGRKLYWYEQIDGTWKIVEKELASGMQNAILSLPISRFDIPDKANLHYQKIGTFKVHSRPLVNVSTEEPVDKLLIDLQGAHTWDAHLTTIYYPSYSQKHGTQMLYAMDLTTGKSKALYPIEAMISVNTGRHLSVTRNGTEAYFTKLEKYQTDIMLLGASL